jgi:hypothetical protein
MMAREKPFIAVSATNSGESRSIKQPFVWPAAGAKKRIALTMAADGRKEKQGETPR